MLLVAFRLVNAPNYHLSLVVASVVQGDAVNCNTRQNKGTVIQVFVMTRLGIQPSPLASETHTQPNVPHDRYQKMMKSHSSIRAIIYKPKRCIGTSKNVQAVRNVQKTVLRRKQVNRKSNLKFKFS